MNLGLDLQIQAQFISPLTRPASRWFRAFHLTPHWHTTGTGFYGFPELFPSRWMAKLFTRRLVQTWPCLLTDCGFLRMLGQVIQLGEAALPVRKLTASTIRLSSGQMRPPCQTKVKVPTLQRV